MGPADAGWTLLSVSRGEVGGRLVGDAACTSPSGATGCAGQLPAAVLRRAEDAELLAVVPATGEWMVLAGWSSDGGLARLAGRVAIPAGSDCSAGCGAALDPNLHVRATSGAPAAHGPIFQWWRLGGVWLGSAPEPGAPCGAALAVAYGGAQGLWARADRAACGQRIGEGPIALYWR
jgi:hypothetical protein